MVKATTGLLFIMIAAFQTITAQNIKDETIEYRYIKLPTAPQPKTVTNYQSSIFATFEVENQKKREQYEADKKAAQTNFEQEKSDYPTKVKAAEDKYKLEMADYPARVKAADDQYNAELAEWNKKSLAKKAIEKELNESTKPVKRNIPVPTVHTPPQPYLHSVPEPTYADGYDYPALAATYLALEGFQNNAENAINIVVTINGFEYTPAKQVTEVRSVVSTVNGVSTTKKVNYYYIEFTYRHTMSVRATSPTGAELLYLTPSELNTYKIYKTTATTTTQPINQEQLISMFEEKILQENLTILSDLVNDKIGFRRELRKTPLYYVKTKDDTYSDLMLAYNEASAALKSIVDNEEDAKAKLQVAIDAWTNALKQSDMNDKKARIDKNVTLAIYFNLLEAYFVTRDVASAEKIITTLNTMSLSNSDKKIKDDYVTLYSDLKKRLQASK